MLSITSLNLDIHKLTAQRDGVKKELQDLYRERDMVESEIREQRNASTIVQTETASLENLRYLLDSQTVILSEIRDKNYNNFSKDYEKHKNILDEITLSIEKANKLLSTYQINKKDIETLENNKNALIEQIKAKKTELLLVSDEIDMKRIELDADIARNEEIKRKNEEEAEINRKEKETMKELKRDLDLLEKRLHAYKLSLKK